MTFASLAPTNPPPERIQALLVGYSTFEVVRHDEDDKHHGRHTRHQPHAPATRVFTDVSSTSTSTGVVATADPLEYAPNAASDQIFDGLKFFYTRSARPVIYRY